MTRAEYDALPGVTQSQVKTFAACKLAWYAEHVAGVYRREMTEAMAIGVLFEALLTGDTEGERRVKESGLLHTGKGELRAAAARVPAMVEAWQKQPVMCELIEGAYSVGLTGEIAGVPVKGLLDVINVDRRRIVDVKTASSFDSGWSTVYNRRVPWWQDWRYHWQGWLYSGLYRQNYEGEPEYIVAAITKQTPPRMQALRFTGSCELFEPEAMIPGLLTEMAELAPQVGIEGQIEACRKTDCEVCSRCIPVTIQDVP